MAVSSGQMQLLLPIQNPHRNIIIPILRSQQIPETLLHLFPVRCKSCFSLLFLAKPHYFDTVLFLIYMVSKLVYPNCTQDEILPKVVTRHNFLKQNYVATIGYTLCSQFTFVFAYVYPILHNIRQRQAADTEHLSPLRF